MVISLTTKPNDQVHRVGTMILAKRKDESEPLAHNYLMNGPVRPYINTVLATIVVVESTLAVVACAASKIYLRQ